MSDAAQQEDLVDLLDRIKDKTDGEEVSIGELVEALGRRAFGSLLVITALIAVLPTGAIPGMSVLTGTIMLLLSVQILIGRDSIWLPKVLTKRAMPRSKLINGIDRIHNTAETVDRLLGPRLTALVEPPFLQAVAVIAILVSLSMYPLALVPFGAFPAGLSLLVIGLGLAVRDGLLIALGLTLAVLGSVAVYWFWPF
ncbi:MAG: exopolysaccharide biosynthesis protein [Pseudomonadota bacterium]